MPIPRLAILLGHSHTGSVISSVTAMDHRVRPDRDPLHLVMYEAWKFNGKPPYIATGADGADCFNPAIFEAAAPYIAGLGTPTYIASFGGNDWAVLSLMEHSRPFDFVLPSHPDLPVQEGAEIVPFGYIQSIIGPLNDTYNQLLYLLRKATDAPILCLAAPPPIADNDFIERKMDDFFRGGTDFTVTVSASTFRKKMWLLQSQNQRKACDELGIRLLEVPTAAMTPDGFLAPDCYGNDATHANATYGSLVLRQIEEAMDVDVHTYHWFS